MDAQDAAKVAAIEARVRRYHETVQAFNVCTSADDMIVLNGRLGSLEWQSVQDAEWLLALVKKLSGGEGQASSTGGVAWLKT